MLPLLRNRTSCRGMTLVELLLVMAILGVVMMAVMSLYIPTHQSTVVQTQVTDVQANLRLAMERITKDLLTAGFLVNGEPVVFDKGDPGDAQDFTIRTRLVGSGFGRIVADPSENTLTLSSPDMVSKFPKGTYVRIVNAVTGSIVGDVYEVVDSGGTEVTLKEMPAGVRPENVLLRLPNATAPEIQTIRYRFNAKEGALERIVNGDVQFLARNLTSVNFEYVPQDVSKAISAQNFVRSVTVSLTGETRALKEGDAIAGAKTRELRSTVSLRNVF
jgi:prepilin-type N-terminal cleavage/methylation domain-containing protein